MKKLCVPLGAMLFIFSGCISIGTYEKKMKLCREFENRVRLLTDEVTALKELNRNLELKYGLASREQEFLQQELDAQSDQIKQIRGTYDQLINELKDEIAKGDIRVSQDGDELTIQMEEQVLFDSGHAEVKPQGKAVLARIAPILKEASDKAIRIEGHTDNVPISKKLQPVFPTNWELSAIRSANVVRFLQENGGVPPQRLTILGYGEYKPVQSNDNQAGRQQNRRVEIKLVPMPAPAKKP